MDHQRDTIYTIKGIAVCSYTVSMDEDMTGQCQRR